MGAEPSRRLQGLRNCSPLTTNEESFIWALLRYLGELKLAVFFEQLVRHFKMFGFQQFPLKVWVENIAEKYVRVVWGELGQNGGLLRPKWVLNISVTTNILKVYVFDVRKMDSFTSQCKIDKSICLELSGNQ